MYSMTKLFLQLWEITRLITEKRSITSNRQNYIENAKNSQFGEFF